MVWFGMVWYLSCPHHIWPLYKFSVLGVLTISLEAGHNAHWTPSKSIPLFNLGVITKLFLQLLAWIPAEFLLMNQYVYPLYFARICNGNWLNQKNPWIGGRRHYRFGKVYLWSTYLCLKIKNQANICLKLYRSSQPIGCRQIYTCHTCLEL